MAIPLTAADARESLTGHVTTKGIGIFAHYGPHLGWSALQRLLADRAYVRYPCAIKFDAGPLQLGEFAHPLPNGERPEAGFTMYVHPLFMMELDRVPALVLYQLAAVNYGVFASAEDAETFGAAALGLTRDEYYDILCAAADEVGGGLEAALPGAPSSGCGGGCGCG